MSGWTSVKGSEFVEKTGMNEKFDMFWDTRMNWGKEARRLSNVDCTWQVRDIERTLSSAQRLTQRRGRSAGGPIVDAGGDDRARVV